MMFTAAAKRRCNCWTSCCQEPMSKILGPSERRVPSKQRPATQGDWSRHPPDVPSRHAAADLEAH
eukprot:2389877-Amphidinium_carterae.2